MSHPSEKAAPPEPRFSAEDLTPSAEENRLARRSRADRIAATVAVLAIGIWIGGMIALGACAAPFVFRLTPGPMSGDAMGAAFARFDRIALGMAVLLLGAEVVRTWARQRSPVRGSRVRRIAAIAMAGMAAYVGLALTPHINELHRSGVRRNVGEEGMLLERVHHRAELVGKLEVALGAILIALHVFTIGSHGKRDEDDDDASAPAPPGARTPS